MNQNFATVRWGGACPHHAPQSSVFIREENLAQQVKEAIERVTLDDNDYTWMIGELERERALLLAEKTHNRISVEIKSQEVDEQLKRLLDMSLKSIITDEEYKQKKAELLGRKFDISEKGDHNGDWLEHFKSFLTLAHQASYIAAEANPDAQRDFLQKIVSNLKLYNKTLIVSYASAFKIQAESRKLENGSPLKYHEGNPIFIFKHKYVFTTLLYR